MSTERSQLINADPGVNKGHPTGRTPFISQWHDAWLKGDRMMPVATPANIVLGLAVLHSIREKKATMAEFVRSDFDDAQMQIEVQDAVIFHDRFGIPVKPIGHAGPGEVAYDPRPKADHVLTGNKNNILSAIYELSLGNEGRFRQHNAFDIVEDVDRYLADEGNLDRTIALFSAAATALATSRANLARGNLLKSLNFRISKKPSEPVTLEQKANLLTALAPVVAEHVYAVGHDLDIPTGQLRTFVANILNPDFPNEESSE